MNATEKARIGTAVAEVLLHDVESGKLFLLSCSRPTILEYVFVYLWVLAKLNCAIYSWLCPFW